MKKTTRSPKKLAIASLGFAEARSTPEGIAEWIDKTPLRPLAPEELGDAAGGRGRYIVPRPSHDKHGY